MKTFQNPEHFAFTNHFGGPHFNKSLLKSRIEMMNKAKSKWLGLGKYGVFIGMLWLCAAFTKPYRAEVAAKIVEKVPELALALPPKTAAKAVFNDFVLDKSLDKPEKDTTQLTVKTPATAEADTQKLVSTTKYVVYGPNVLHFLITAKTTFEDLLKIRQELSRNGMSLEVLAWQMDSMGLYLQKVQILVKASSGNPQLISRGFDVSYKPISPIAFTIQLKPMSFMGGTISMKGFSNIPQESSLMKLALADNEFADFDVRWSKSVYEKVAKNLKLGFYRIPVPSFLAKSLLKEDTPQFYRAFAIITNEEQREVLKVNLSLKNAKFRLNDNPADIADIENIPPDKFIKADKYEVYDDKKAVSEIYMLVYTKQ